MCRHCTEECDARWRKRRWLLFTGNMVKRVITFFDRSAMATTSVFGYIAAPPLRAHTSYKSGYVSCYPWGSVRAEGQPSGGWCTYFRLVIWYRSMNCGDPCTSIPLQSLS